MTQPLKNILEAALMAAGGPLSVERMQSLFEEHEIPAPQDIREALTELKNDLLGRGIELAEVASGFRFQVRTDVAPWVARLWEERPQRYSRALLETLALIAYRQPITRGDIEDVRGVVVSSGIMKTLLEREWVRVVGHRDVPGRPAMYATTKEFLDYFGLKSLEELPTLMEIRELDDANRKLELGEDADARKEPAKEYEFQSEEEVAQRGADVLSETEDDLEAAKSMVDRVEKNLFHRDEEDGEDPVAAAGEKRPTRSIGDLLERLEKTAQEEQNSDADGDAPAEESQDENSADGGADTDNGGETPAQDSDSAVAVSEDAGVSDDDADPDALTDDAQPAASVVESAPSVFGETDSHQEPRLRTEESNQSSGAASSEDDDAETGDENEPDE